MRVFITFFRILLHIRREKGAYIALYAFRPPVRFFFPAFELFAKTARLKNCEETARVSKKEKGQSGEKGGRGSKTFLPLACIFQPRNESERNRKKVEANKRKYNLAEREKKTTKTKRNEKRELKTFVPFSRKKKKKKK